MNNTYRQMIINLVNDGFVIETTIDGKPMMYSKNGMFLDYVKQPTFNALKKENIIKEKSKNSWSK